jgi:hypothetical protein
VIKECVFILDKLASALEQKGLMKYAYVIDIISNTLEQGSLLELMKKTPDPDTKAYLTALVDDARRRGISVTEPGKLEEFMRNTITQRSLGPLAPKKVWGS